MLCIFTTLIALISSIVFHLSNLALSLKSFISWFWHAMKMLSNVSAWTWTPAATLQCRGCWQSTACGGEMKGFRGQEWVGQLSVRFCVLYVDFLVFMLLKITMYMDFHTVVTKQDSLSGMSYWILTWLHWMRRQLFCIKGLICNIFHINISKIKYVLCEYILEK